MRTRKTPFASFSLARSNRRVNKYRIAKQPNDLFVFKLFENKAHFKAVESVNPKKSLSKLSNLHVLIRAVAKVEVELEK